jgi:hypothetical protein
MDNDTKTIRIGYGLGELPFGSSRDEVRSYLGDPEELSEDFTGENQSVDWSYPSLGIDAYFSGEDDFRLGTLRTENPDAALFGERIMALPEAHVRSWLERQIGPPTEEVMEFSDHPSLLRLSYPKLGLEFWFKNERLDAVLWSYLIGDDDQVQWPTQVTPSA